LVPALLVASGRSGSTMLMRLLASSPRVATETVFPFEHQYLRYFRLLSRTIEARAWDGAQWDHLKFHMASADPAWTGGMIGPPPWRDARLLEPAEGEASFADRALVAIWSEFSARVATRAATGGAPVPTYWAEKCPDHPDRLDLPATLAPKCVFLVRDPRDQWLSAARMALRSDGRGFHRLLGAADAAALERWLETESWRMPKVVESVERDRDRALLVRYEDVIADGEAESRRIAEFLGVDLDPGALGVFDRDHATSRSPERSVGRWRRELDAVATETIELALGRSMARLGYALGADAKRVDG